MLLIIATSTASAVVPQECSPPCAAPQDLRKRCRSFCRARLPALLVQRPLSVALVLERNCRESVRNHRPRLVPTVRNQGLPDLAQAWRSRSLS